MNTESPSAAPSVPPTTVAAPSTHAHAPAHTAPPTPWKAVFFSLAFSLVLAAAGYAWKGSPALITATPPPPHAQTPTGADGAQVAGMDAQQFLGLVEKLRERLQNEPNNAEGWAMLGRSYMVLERAADAVPALARAVALVPDDAGLMADYAVALGVNNGRSLEGEAARAIDRALRIDPKQPRALSLAGSLAFERKDYAGAIRQWELALTAAPAEGEFAEQLKTSIAQAREASGAAAAVSLSPASPTASTAPNAAPNAAADRGRVSGQASLAPEALATVQPEDTVFIFARPAGGSRMPLAIVRKQVKDLPFAFTLDDSMAMAPDARLSGAERVIVGVRVSKSGNATPQPGDWQGFSEPVAPGARDVQVVARERIKP